VGRKVAVHAVWVGHLHSFNVTQRAVGWIFNPIDPCVHNMNYLYGDRVCMHVQFVPNVLRGEDILRLHL